MIATRRTLGPMAGFLVGGAIGLGALLAAGAAQGPKRDFPRYAVSASGGSLLITDNDTNTLYVYQNTPDDQGRIVHRVHHVVDLNQTGQGELKPLAVGKR